MFTGETPFIGEPDDKVRRGCLELQCPTSSQVDGRGFNDALWKLLSGCISREPSARPRFQRIQAHISLMRKAESSSHRLGSGRTLLKIVTPLLIFPTVAEDHQHHVTNWIDGTEPIMCTASTSPTLGHSTTPLLPVIGKSGSGEEPSLSSRRYTTHDIKNVPPVCVEVTLKYFGVKFGISAREPGAFLEENNSLQWQPIRTTKRSLLRCVSDEGCDYPPAHLLSEPRLTDSRSGAVTWKEIIHGT